MNYNSLMNTDSNEDMTTRQRRGAKKRAKTRADLLAAARKVFATRGYHEASIFDITEEADVGVGTFYLHFKDKEEAFATLIDEVFHILEEQVITEVHNHGLITLPVIVHSILSHAYEQRELFRIALTGGTHMTQTLRVEDTVARGLTRAFEQAEKEGHLQGANIPLLARLVTGVIAQGIIWWFTNEGPEPEQMAEQILLLLAHGLPASLLQGDDIA